MNSENSAHQVVRFQDAQAMYYQGRRKDAAAIAEMAPSTFTHRMAGVCVLSVIYIPLYAV